MNEKAAALWGRGRALHGGVAKLVNAAVLKTASPCRDCGFESRRLHLHYYPTCGPALKNLQLIAWGHPPGLVRIVVNTGRAPATPASLPGVGQVSGTSAGSRPPRPGCGGGPPAAPPSSSSRRPPLQRERPSPLSGPTSLWVDRIITGGERSYTESVRLCQARAHTETNHVMGVMEGPNHHSPLVERRPGKPLFPGSNPGGASSLLPPRRSRLAHERGRALRPARSVVRREGGRLVGQLAVPDGVPGVLLVAGRVVLADPALLRVRRRAGVLLVRGDVRVELSSWHVRNMDPLVPSPPAR